MDEYEVYSTDAECEVWYSDLPSIVESMLEAGYSQETPIYAFSCADYWQEDSGENPEWKSPEGFSAKLLRKLTLAEASMGMEA